MKVYNIDILSDIDLEMTPLTEDQEGNLHGGFVVIIGSASPLDTNNGCSNSSCTNNGCHNTNCSGCSVPSINTDCTNNGCENVGCKNNECPTGSSKPTSTDGNGFTSSIMGLLI